MNFAAPSAFKLLGGVLLALAIGTLLHFAKDRFVQKAKADAAERCATASSKPLADLSDCLKPVRERITAARKADLCDAAADREDGRFVVLNACGQGVKRLYARNDVAARRVANLEGELAKARAATRAVVARAEARAVTLTERKADARKAIEAAPRDGAGRITCDALCLRRLSQ